MRIRGLVLATALLSCVLGCDSFGGFPRPIEIATFLKQMRRIDAGGAVMEPRFGAGPGLFLAYTGPDADGTAAVFRLAATNLQSTPVSVPAARTDGAAYLDGASTGGAVSGNGQYVAFLSLATNVLDMDTSGTLQAYFRDLATEENLLVSHNSDGDESNAPVTSVAISASGRFVAFATAATNLHPGATNGLSQIYLYDRSTSQLQLISHNEDAFAGNGGSWAPALSVDGRFVGFHSEADDLVDDDTNGTSDIYVYDRSLAEFDRASLDSAEDETLFENRWAALSQNARYVAFSSLAAGVRQVYVRDRQEGTTQLVSMDPGTAIAGDADSDGPSISSDGRFIAFHTDATNLAAGDSGLFTDIYVYDRVGAAIARASVNGDGEEGTGDSWMVSISPDGQAVGFLSLANNLVADDGSFVSDLFLGPNPLFE